MWPILYQILQGFGSAETSPGLTAPVPWLPPGSTKKHPPPSRSSFSALRHSLIFTYCCLFLIVPTVMLRSVFWAKMRPEVGVVKGHLRRVLDDNPNPATDSAGWKIPTNLQKQNPTGVRKRHAKEEQLLVAKRTSAGVVHEEGKHERSDLRCDWAKIAILFLLYLLQGIPIGLAAAIPMMLQNRGASYKQQVRVDGWAGDASYLDGVDMR
ncbi:conserved hypothetical protein [Culex quinquefasciatus]|uniref:Uncharacterized protein n=1 Tax=Culex quinquefasciatus TaxID=7176 RepID=B0XF84_CULQU|nr:conserved hypothetical protein [Culex quinquefasciatus]|eukprot:XP_001868306.1 conserved hypothetical protein [Culex quinquefasciatus]